MGINSSNEMPLWQLSIKVFSSLIEEVVNKVVNNKIKKEDQKKYAYGIRGIADTFDCSIATASRIKQSGIINDAITQIGRKILIDPEKAIELAKQHQLDFDELKSTNKQI
jgi:hypothetical protein